MSDDVLALLREHISENKAIDADEENLFLGEHTIALSEPTFYRSQRGGGPYYSVGQVYHFYLNREQSHSKYVAELGGKSTAVSYVDRKDLINYLSGKSSSSRAIKKPKEPVKQKQAAESKKAVAAADIAPMEKDDDTGAAAAASAPTSQTTVTDDDDVQQQQEQQQQQQDQQQSNETKKRVAPYTPPGSPPRPDANAEARKAAVAARRERKRLATEERAKQKEQRAALTQVEPLAPEQEAAAAATRAILNSEMKLRNRKTVLQTVLTKDGAPFFTSLIANVKRVRELEKLSKKMAQASKKRGPNAYDRYDVKEDQFWKERTGMSGVDGPAGSFAASGVGLADALDKEGSSKSSSKRQKVRTTANKDHIPIIVVPDNTGPITMANVREAFELGTYTAPVAGAPREQEISCLHNGAPILIMASSAASRMRESVWLKRVCCVLVQGQAWQFRDWAISDPLKLFNVLCGVSFRFNDERPPPAILSWRVKQHVLSRSKNHVNKTSLRKFWEELKRWAIIERPHLVIK